MTFSETRGAFLVRNKARITSETQICAEVLVAFQNTIRQMSLKIAPTMIWQ